MPDSLEKAIATLRKKYGITVTTIGNEDAIKPFDSIATGILSLDLATQIGGIPKGAITEIYGPDGAGKTTLCAQVAASAQRSGLHVFYIDMEHRADVEYMRILGVDIDKLLFLQPDTGNDALNAAQSLIETGDLGLVIIDSIPALIPVAETEAEIGDSLPGLQARLISQTLRMIMPSIRVTNTALVVINQLRASIGINSPYGPKNDRPGGHALKHMVSMRIELKRIKTVKEKEIPVGIMVQATIQKSSVGIPLRAATVMLRFGVGFDRIDDLLTLGERYGVIERTGAYYMLGDIKAHGRNAMIDYIASSVDVEEKLFATIMSAKDSNGVIEVADDES